MADFQDEQDGRGLGQLPPDLFEQVERAYVSPADSAVAQGVGAGFTGKGMPGYNLDVRSVFDSRPVNAKDFDFSVSVYAYSDLLSDTSLYSFTFTVPADKIMILREFRYLPISEEKGYTNDFPVTYPMVPTNLPFGRMVCIGINLTVNDTIVYTPSEFTNGSEDILNVAGKAKIFVLAAPNSKIKLDISYMPQIQDGYIEPSYVIMGFRGNLLLDKGLPLPYTVASEK